MLGEKSTAPCSARKTLHRAGRDRRPIVLGVESPLRCGAGKAPHRAGGEKHCNGEFSTRQAPWSCRFTPSTLECLSHRAPWSAWSHRAPWSAVHAKHPGAPFTPSTLELPFTPARCGAADESMCRDGSLGRGSRCDARKSGNSPQHSHSKTPCASQRVLAHRSGRRQYGHGSGSGDAEVVKGPAVNAGTAPSRW